MILAQTISKNWFSEDVEMTERFQGTNTFFDRSSSESWGVNLHLEHSLHG